MPGEKKLALIGGGARSGKSRFAMDLARRLAAGGGAVFIATAEARDAEMAERIRRHRADRGPGFETVEEPLALAAALDRAAAGGARVVLVDCLTLWLANLLGDGGGGAGIGINRESAERNTPSPRGSGERVGVRGLRSSATDAPLPNPLPAEAGRGEPKRRQDLG